LEELHVKLQFNVIPPLTTIQHYDPEEDSWTLLGGRRKKGYRNVTAVSVYRDLFD
jgi:hypothetical protein